MDRRGFLRMLGMGAAAAVAPTKAYSFLGGILRPHPAFDMDALVYHERMERLKYQAIELAVNPPVMYSFATNKIYGMYPKNPSGVEFIDLTPIT